MNNGIKKQPAIGQLCDSSQGIQSQHNSYHKRISCQKSALHNPYHPSAFWWEMEQTSWCQPICSAFLQKKVQHCRKLAAPFHLKAHKSSVWGVQLVCGESKVGRVLLLSSLALGFSIGSWLVTERTGCGTVWVFGLIQEGSYALNILMRISI